MKFFRKYQNLLLLLFISSMLLLGCSTTINVNDNDQVNPHSNISKEVDADIPGAESSSLSVHFLDVGQGNALLAESDGHYMLIDGGDREYSSYVVSYLKKQGVKELDYVIISHYDADHLNGIVGVLNVLDVKTILSPDYVADTNVYKSYLDTMDKKDYQAKHPAIGNTYHLGNASFTIVAPVNYDYLEANNNSIGIKLEYGSNSFLILGDAESESETDILSVKEDISADVYLTSHHGSDSSSSAALLKAVNPTYAVISVGNNSYGHPAKEVLDRLKTRDIKLFRTDIQGTIIASSDGKKITWNTDPTSNWSSGSTNTSETKNESSITDTITVSDHYIGNSKTHKFHLPSCSGLPDKKNQIILKKRQEFIKKGYEPCKICNP
ncbi:beta-lactamase superfamily II metal-dependent hydrolase [Mobilisporobacter senegalensis]|uniref:Beta-lactamase superfamily II metal-dependent hydrolase n=1 Tax=Mobilisporobacter senegalensis TaxID=1329262 RepID=A0A3N1XNF8_9FIRM|nr:ComEC/Rec2 family competence protein [Mobilisporobacter senegalensis]ROR28214.1 beta-lactamase superfamily II metal-dependent hydrolase [Mobilisporobacter senegalensis]